MKNEHFGLSHNNLFCLSIIGLLFGITSFYFLVDSLTLKDATCVIRDVFIQETHQCDNRVDCEQVFRAYFKADVQFKQNNPITQINSTAALASVLGWMADPSIAQADLKAHPINSTTTCSFRDEPNLYDPTNVDQTDSKMVILSDPQTTILVDQFLITIAFSCLAMLIGIILCKLEKRANSSRNQYEMI